MNNPISFLLKLSFFSKLEVSLSTSKELGRSAIHESISDFNNLFAVSVSFENTTLTNMKLMSNNRIIFFIFSLV